MNTLIHLINVVASLGYSMVISTGEPVEKDCHVFQERNAIIFVCDAGNNKAVFYIAPFYPNAR